MNTFMPCLFSLILSALLHNLRTMLCYMWSCHYEYIYAVFVWLYIFINPLNQGCHTQT